MGFSSSGAFDSNSPSPPFSFMPTTTSFSDLLNSPAPIADDTSTPPSARTPFSVRAGGSGIPKFKSLPPPSLPLSPPSYYFSIPAGLSPAELLDSPVLLLSSHIMPSPTTGALLGQSNTTSVNNHQSPQIKREDNFYSDFTFDTQHHQIPTRNEEAKPHDQTNADDGYKWRKYGQKQVKGSENPRSYYKCTFPGCPIRKKVEMCLDGQITEIVYKGTHNHPKPVKAPKLPPSSSSSVFTPASAGVPMAGCYQNLVDGKENSNSLGDEQKEALSVATPENSSISIVEDEIDGDERQAKRWKGEGESECISGVAAAAQGRRAVREPKVVVKTTSDIDILDDGYRWRKYGQKVVKGNPNPRSYYKCTYPGCPVRKHVERAAEDIRSVITTYEGKHHHDLPPARGSTHSVARLPMGVVRPSPVNYAPQLPYNPSDHQQPEMIPNLAQGFEFSEFGRSMADYNSYGVNQHLRLRESASDHTKEEPRDDVFFDSLLS